MSDYFDEDLARDLRERDDEKYNSVHAEQALHETLFEAFRHFCAMDVANSAIHCAEPRWSPITFRLMEQLIVCYPTMYFDNQFVRTVCADWRTYEEDKGR